MSKCIGDMRHIMSAHIFDISAQSIIIWIIVMEHDMQSSTACRMSLLIESVCRIANLHLLLHPPRIGAWPPLGVPVRRQAHNRV
jgi:hypothetical protein